MLIIGLYSTLTTTISVVDPNILNLDPDPRFRPYLDPDPRPDLDPGSYRQFINKKNKKCFLKKNNFL